MRILRTSVLVVALYTLLVSSCDHFIDSTANKQERLAKRICSACHLYTPPDLLDKTSWSTVLDAMRNEAHQADVLITKEEWSQLYDFYVNGSDLFLPPQSPRNLEFAPRRLDTTTFQSELAPFIFLMDCQNKDSAFYIGGRNGQISTYEGSVLQPLVQAGNFPVQLKTDKKDDSFEILSMGTFNPLIPEFGSLQLFREGQLMTLIDSLIRPVHFEKYDFNGDGTDEYIVSSFGMSIDSLHSGGLSLFDLSSGHTKRVQISRNTGALKSKIVDWNGDGLTDIVALFAQGDEKIQWFENKGDFNFEEHTLLRVHPLYGCNDFVIRDFDADGDWDVALVNGDNADYSTIFKAYHGFRVFVNLENGTLKESLFIPINGAARIHPYDFNRDGAEDFLVSSLYPNLFLNKGEQLTLLLSSKPFQYEAFEIQESALNNMALCAVCDLDQNGKAEIYVGGNEMLIRDHPDELVKRWMSKPLPLYHYEIEY